ncbi:hypothetical protein STRCI_008633 [Streptomyces cinnabarinus]|uniref:Uncharacterized protein n=1 Tax=Streptomyces cinnabarinus TaxID=67287 RepID=A0ABY7KW75_9ACTN|nr:hypothetical protein [Streptomyces cinnabarinus]WAZ27367.1 hypothetical protein STRCI_008633 [Streptomyces cinnabarinus]
MPAPVEAFLEEPVRGRRSALLALDPFGLALLLVGDPLARPREVPLLDALQEPCPAGLTDCLPEGAATLDTTHTESLECARTIAARVARPSFE